MLCYGLHVQMPSIEGNVGLWGYWAECRGRGGFGFLLLRFCCFGFLLTFLGTVINI